MVKEQMVKKEKIAMLTYKAVNYVGLIFLLTQALIEQPLEIEALQQENKVLKEIVETRNYALEKIVKEMK